MSSIAYTVSGNTLTVFFDGEPTAITSSHPNFKAILEQLAQNKDPSGLFDPDRSLREYLGVNDVSMLMSSQKDYLHKFRESPWPRMQRLAVAAFGLMTERHISVHNDPEYLVAGPGQLACIMRDTTTLHTYAGRNWNTAIIAEKPERGPGDELVFEMVEAIEQANDGIAYVTNYRTLVLGPGRSPILDPTGLKIETGGRLIRSPDVSISIDFLRTYADSQEAF